MPADQVVVDRITHDVIAAAIRVHRQFGPGLLHSVYLPCMAQELLERGFWIEIEKPIPLQHGSLRIECAYRIDLVINECVVVEVKCVDKILPIHVAQMLTYLRLGNYPVGLLINFNVTLLKDGIRRIVNELKAVDGTLA